MNEFFGKPGVDLFAQVADVYVHDVRAALIVVVPEIVLDALAREHDALVPDHVFEQGVFAARQLNDAPGADDRVRAHVHGEIGDRINVRARVGILARHHAHHREQLLHVERLYKIVIRAGLQPLDLVLDAVAGREEQHGRRAAALAQLTHERQPVHAGHHNVEHEHVVFRARKRVPRLLPVKAWIDAVPLVGQRLGQNAVEISLILRHKNSHDSSPRSIVYRKIVRKVLKD